MPLAVSTLTRTRSSSTAPMLPWLRVVLLASLLAAGSICSLDAHWRSAGFRPTVPDGMDLWYFWRQQVDGNNGKVIVFLGSSRITADISIETLHECLPD